MLEANKALVRRLVEDVFNGRRLETADEVLASDFVSHNTLAAGLRGPEGTKRANQLVRAAFPDWTESIEELIAERDRVVLYAIGRGTHLGEFMGTPPTGCRVEVSGMAIFRIGNGQIVEQWGLVDMAGLLRQLGAPGR